MDSNSLRFDLYEPQDGHPDWDACAAAAREQVAAIAPIIRKTADLTAADRLKDAGRKVRGMATAGQNYAINRRRYAAGNHALRPLYAIWTMLNACNFRCTYCDNHQGEAYFNQKDDKTLDTAGGRRLLDVIRTGTAAIYFCGGEPTMRPDLPELLAHAWERGFFPTMINTNGSLLHKQLAKPAWRDFLWQMDMVIVSVDGLDLARLRTLWGVKKPEQVVVNLLTLRELRRQIGFKLVVNTVIAPDTIDEARAVLNLANDLGVWFVPVPVNVRHEPNRELLDDPRYVELAETILERKKRGYPIIGSSTLLRSLLFCTPYRCFTALKPHVWPSGEICWPCRASANVKPAEVQLLDYETLDAAYEAGRQLVNPDFFHGPAANQCGGDCAWMQNYTTARYMDGVIHPLSSGLLDEIREFALSRKHA